MLSKYTAIPFAVIITFFSSCGVFESKYVNYLEESPLTECEKQAVEVFKTSIQSIAVASCTQNGGGCHASVPISGSRLSTSSELINRNIFKAYTGTDPNVLFKKISLDGKSHGGGDKSSDLPLATIKEWTDKEGECASAG